MQNSPTSPTDTIETEEDESPSLFARIRPHNSDACSAFSDIVERIINNESLYAHHKNFIQYDSHKIPLRLATVVARRLNTDIEAEIRPETETETESEHETKSEGEDEKEMVWAGCYHLSLATHPAKPALGWRVGSGRWRMGSTGSDPQGGVDILLSDDARRTGVRGSHARFAFMKDTGLLLLHARHAEPHSVSVDNESFALQQRALNARTSILRFGNLEYTFTYTIRSNSYAESLFQLAKLGFFRRYLHAPPPVEATSATPGQNDMVLGDWTLHGAIGRGTFGTVSAASHRTGTVAAFKSLLRYSKSSDKSVRVEVKVAEQLKPFLEEHDRKRRIIRLMKVIYQREDSLYDGGAPEAVWILYTPLARGTFKTHILDQEKNNVSETVRASLFKQVIDGLACLHTHGWVHRDIKPLNLGVVSIEPPKAVILDIGSVCHMRAGESGIKPRPGAYGTVSYLAPEVETETYNERVDIWALGLVGHEIFLGRHPWQLAVNPWRPDTNPNYQYYLKVYSESLQDLRNAHISSTKNLISKMLAWDPRERLSAVDALEHDCMRGIAMDEPDPLEGVRTSSKRPRD